MAKLYLDKGEIQKVNTQKEKYLERCKRKFFSKKMNHLNNERLKNFYNQFLKDVNYSDKLFLVKFKSSFSFYLYLYLAAQAKGFDTDESCIFQPIEFSICGTQKLTRLARNTVRKAFRELIEVGLVFYEKDMVQKRHNLTKSIIILNDDYLIDFDARNRKIIYSINTNI